MPKIDRFVDGYEIYSNFYPKQVWFENVLYETNEHAYQAAKSTDEDEREEIRCAPSPGKAKKLGRAVKFLRPDWDTYKFKVMEELVREKFKDPDLRKQLLDTKEWELVEGNHWHDNIWGDCSCGRASCQKPGENHLGKTLMKIRSEIRNASATDAV